MRKKISIFIVASLVLSMLFSYSVFSSDIAGTESLIPEGESEDITEDYIDDTENTIDWDNIFVKLNDKEYSFPMSYEDITKDGWILPDDVLNTKFEPLHYEYSFISNENNEEDIMFFLFTNQSYEETTADKCIINGIGAAESYYNYSDYTVEFPGGIILGQSTVDDMRNIYGEEDIAFESDTEGQTTFKYSDGFGKELTFESNTESGVIVEGLYSDTSLNEKIAGDTLTEFTENQMLYEKPDAIGDVYEDYRIEVEGLTYTLPAPVAEFLSDGWSVVDGDPEHIFISEETQYLRFVKDGKQFVGCVANIEGNPCTYAYAWVVAVSVSLEDDYNIDSIEEESEDFEETDLAHMPVSPANVVLPGNIKLGMNRESFVNAIEERDIPYAPEESDVIRGYFIGTKDEASVEEESIVEESEEYEYYDEENIDEYYFLMQTYENTYKVSVYTGDDGKYEKDSVISIEVINNPLALDLEE